MANVFDRLDRIEKNQTQGKKEKRSALDRLDKIQPVKDTAKKVDADSLSRPNTTPKNQAKTDTAARGSKRKSFFSYDREATSGYGQANRSPMVDVPRNAVRAEKKTEDQNGEKFSVGKLAGGMAVKGATDFAKSISGTLSFLEGAVTKPLDQLMGADGEFVESGMFHKLNEDIKAEQEAAREYFQPNVERGGKAAEIADFLGTTTISAIPQGLMATVAGSTKAAQTGVDVVAKAKDLAPGIWNSVRSLAARSAKDPAFWSSFFQTIGNDYEEAIADGASELKAVSYAIGNGLLNAQVEVGGGLETMDEAGDMGIKALAKAAKEEGNEEVIQGIIQRGLQNLVYEKGNPIASVSDENAVLNPITSAQEWAGGAFAGGVLSGARIGGNYLAGQAYNRQLANIGADYQVEPEALVQEGLSFPQGTEARRTAEQMQEKIKSGTALTDTDLGKMVAANEQTMYQQRQLEWANTPAEERTAYGDRALLETARSMTREQQETDSRNGQTAEQDESRIGRDIQDNMERVRRAAGALGESGGKALTAAYTEDTAKTIAPKDAVEGFYRVYNAAMKGEQLTDTDAQSAAALPAHLRFAAESAGKQDALRAKQAQFFGEKAGLVKDDSWKKAHLSSKTNRTLDALGKALGVQIKFAETVADGQSNGQYVNGTITLALDANDPVLTTVTHEAVHRLREMSPEAYSALADFVRGNLSEETTDYALLKREVLNRSSDADAMTEEMVADAFGRVLNDGKAIERLVQDNRSLAEKVRDVLADIVNAVKRVLNHQNLELTAEQKAEFRELEARMSEMERLFGDALGKAEAQNGGKNTAKTDGGIVVGTEGGYANVNGKFSLKGVVEDNGDLLALHNLTEKNLLDALELGGLPMPSIAVVRAETGHTKYGPISLVLDKSSIDPQADWRNKVYGGDAWTPTAPKIEYEPTKQAEDRLRDKYYDLARRIGYDKARPLYNYATDLEEELNRNGGEQAIIEKHLDDTSMMNLYLADTGRDMVEDIYKEIVHRIDDATREQYDFIINALGEGVINELRPIGDESSATARKRWLENHGETLENAYRDYLRREGAEESEIENAMESPSFSASALVRDVVLRARNYMRIGPETRRTEYDAEATRAAIMEAVDQASYREWLNETFSGLVKRTGIYNGKKIYNRRGNRRSWGELHNAYTLENIVNAMRNVQEERGQGAWGVGATTLQAVAAPSYKSIQEMKGDSGKLGAVDGDEYTAAVEAVDAQIYGIIQKIKATNKSHSDNSFVESDNIATALKETAKGRKTIDAIMRSFAEYGYKISNQTAKDIQMLYKAASDLPTEYFEAKPQRAVGLDEVLAAIIPDDSSEKLRTGLEQAGVRTLEYKSGDDTDRLAKVNSVDGARFSLKEDSNGKVVSDNRGWHWNDLSYRSYRGYSPMSRAGYAMMADDPHALHAYGDKVVAVRQAELKPISEFQDKIAENWELDKENGTLPYALETELGHLSGEEVAAAFDPDDIVDSADAWDNEDMVQWAYEKVFDGIPGVKTSDGAIVFDEGLLHSIDPEADVLGNEMHGESRKESGKRFSLKEDSQVRKLTDANVAIDRKTESASPVRYSLKTWTASDYVEKREDAAKALSKSLGVSKKKALSYIDDINSIAKTIADDRVRLDYEASPGRSSFVGNTEYGGSIDFSTICAKRRLLTGTFEAIQAQLPNTALTAENILTIRKMMADRGYQVSCGLCYVEGSRANMGQYTKQFLTEYAETNPKYLPNMAEMNTASGQEQVRIHHPEVYEAYEKFMNKLAQRKPKMYQMATEYQGEILNKFKGKKQAESVAEKNKNGGIRFQSFSDFEVIHLIDNMQVIMDMAKVGLAGQAYTKVPNFAWAMGDTGLKINLSLIAKGVDKNGKIILDEVEGMPRSDAEALRKRYSDNVGTILVIFNDDQLKSALNDPFIDFIIPFHRSQWNSAQYEMMGLPANAKDYTMWQNESYIEPVYSKSGKKMRPANYMPNEYWDFNRSGKENAESYLKMCAANNRKPKFSNLLDRNADGSYSLRADGSTDGYWKLLIDFKMYDNDGNGSPQKPVVPNFNMDEAARMMAEYEGGHEKFPVANDVVEDFVAQYKKENPGIRYSLKPVPPVRPKSKDWKPGATFDEVKESHPTLFALDADEADTRNPTQITGTVKSYRKIYDALQAENFDGTILDASSGLGYGTRAGREEYGFDVDDIEPFPDAKYQPNYTDYSALDKTYDVIISNAVLNVMPQDLRDAMVVKIGEMLNPGGRAFINVRGTDVKNAGSKVAINDDLMEYFISNTGSYQKGFTSKELVSYLKDALGDGFTVEPTRKFGAVSAIVTRDGDRLSMDVNEKFSRSDRELLSDYVKKYGAIPRGEKPSREILLPRKTAADKKVSQTVRTILEAGATPDGMVPTVEDMVAKGDFSYDAYTDKQAISDAESQIKKVGWAQALMDWTKAVKSGEVSKANTAMGWALYNNAANSGDTKTALTVLTQMVEHQRSAAQALQATRILKSMSPETQLYGVQRSVENLQDELNKRYGDKKGHELKIDEDLAERFMKAKDQESRDELLKEIYRYIGRQMPSRFIDRWNAWRYLAMLGNTRTHVRNIVGNAGFMPVVATKNLVGTAIESAVYRVSGGKLNRSKALIWGGKQDRALLSAAWGDYAKVQEAALGGGKYRDFANANRYIEEGRKIFGNTRSGLWNATGGKALETFRKANSAALDVEDVWFSKPHYAYALSQYCKAHGITAEQIASGKGLKAAREYAILEAQKATYRDTNALSQAISELGRSSRTEKNKGRKAVATIMEGILPFRKTPANILARGVEYSPIGLVNGIKEALWDVQKGTKTGAEAIDAISAGLSGTGLLALGLYMAAQGLVRGHGGDDDKKKKFEEMQGHQAYALELPDGRSVTLDWLAPEALPFFIGVNLWEETGGERATLSDWMTSTKLVTEPLLEMSCLQSLNAVFDAVGYASSEGLDGLPAALASAGTSYLTQALPTVLGQAERTGEDKRYTTYTEKNAFLTGDIQYTLGKAGARIPGWDYQQIPYIDAWGRTESSGNAGTRAFNNFVNPAYTSQIQTSEMEKELLRLYEATGESGVFPQRAEKYFTVDQERKDLTAQEYVKYAELKGQSAYQLVTDLVKDKKYQAMSDQDKAAAVENAYKLANQQAKQKVGGYKPESWIIKAAEAEKKHGIDQETYVLLKTQTAGIESLKDKDGETISNSKGLQIMELVYGYTGLSDKQKEAMFEYLGVGKTIRHYNPGKVKQELEKMKKK